jgi:CheY-like chemotaxis protein
MAGPEKPRVPLGNGQTILVVDDERTVRDVTSRTLEKHGYRTILAEDGAAALAAYAQHRDRIDALLVDLAMPIMDGLALVSAVRRINDKIPVLVATGDPSSPVQEQKLVQLQRLGVHRFLNKPYSSVQLLEAVHGMLE